MDFSDVDDATEGENTKLDKTTEGKKSWKKVCRDISRHPWFKQYLAALFCALCSLSFMSSTINYYEIA